MSGLLDICIVKGNHHKTAQTTAKRHDGATSSSCFSSSVAVLLWLVGGRYMSVPRGPSYTPEPLTDFFILTHFLPHLNNNSQFPKKKFSHLLPGEVLLLQSHITSSLIIRCPGDACTLTQARARTHTHTHLPHNLSSQQPLSPLNYRPSVVTTPLVSPCLFDNLLIMRIRAAWDFVAYLSSSPPPGSCSICSPAPSPAPSRKLCADSPLRASGVNPKHSLCQPVAPPVDPPPSSLPSSLRSQVIPFYAIPVGSSPRRRVPLTRRSPGVCAAESATFPCSIWSDMCRLPLSRSPSPSLFPPFLPVRQSAPALRVCDR